MSATKLLAQFQTEQGRIENNGSQEESEEEEETLTNLLSGTRGRRKSASP
jgi:hypothetical protein